MERETTIECPHCDGEGVCLTAADGTSCGDCGEGNMCEVCLGEGEVEAPDPRLKGRTTCAVCGHRYSWGCGHTPDDESATLDHEQTTDHLLGDCDCYVSRAGYAARYSRQERREAVAKLAAAVTALERETMVKVAELDDILFPASWR